ncbi:hypothetical protein [Ruegeria atlantica]|uniref:hypothetical protein n=1 Tax=Ruegeria atlantica TaxID=81569 RepID=UPI00147D3C3A|nr:hypothetical protein [Ruegeria atlantica]
MIKNVTSIATFMFALCTTALHAETDDGSMFAKDVGAMIGLAEACDVEPSEYLSAVEADVSKQFPQEVEATKVVGRMATVRDKGLCDRAPEILKEFDLYIADRG